MVGAGRLNEVSSVVVLVWWEGSLCSTVVQPEKQTRLPNIRRQKVMVFIGWDLICYLSEVVVVVVFLTMTLVAIILSPSFV